MTLPVQTPQIAYAEDGATTEFPVPFRYGDPTYIRAERKTSSGVVTALAYGTDYSVSPGNTDAGGTLTVTSPAASGNTLVIWRETPLKSDGDYETNAAFTADTHEKLLDEAAMRDQDQQLAIDRAPKVPRGESIGDLPALVQRQGDLTGAAAAVSYAAYDADGNPTSDTPDNFAAPALAARLGSESARDAAIAYLNPFPSQAAGEAGTAEGELFNYLDVNDQVALAKRTAGGSTLLPTYFGATKVASDDGAGGTLWTHLGGFVAYLLSSAGSAVVGFLQSGLDAVARSIQEKLRESVSVFDYMTAAEKAQVIAGGTALDLSASLAKAFAAAQALGVELVWPQGVYAYTVSPNWAWNQSKHRAIGTVRLRNMGAGHAVIYDGGAAGTGPGFFGCRAVGRFVIEGASTSQDGVWLRACHHCDLEFYIRGAGLTYAGVRMLFSVCSIIRGGTTPNEEGWFEDGGAVTARPQSALVLNIRGAGEFVSYCTFPNYLSEAVSGIGIQLLGTLGNVFLGGTSEGCGSYGVFGNSGAHQDRFIGMDFEVNTTADVYLTNASAVVFEHCDSDLSIVIGAGCKKCGVIKGLHQSVLLDAGALRSIAHHFVYNRFGTSGTFTDAGDESSVRGLSDGNGNIWGVGTAAFGGSPIAAGAVATVQVPVTGAKINDHAKPTFSNPTQNMRITGSVYAAGFVSVVVENISGASITPTAGTMKVRIERGS